jgi:hypothetical protein
MSDRRRGEGEKTGTSLPMMTEFPTPDFMQMTTNIVNVWSEVNDHLFNFAQQSMHNNISAVDDLRKVQSPKDLMDVQLRVARQVYDSCLDEAAKIGQMVQKFSTEAMSAFTSQKSN